MHEVKHVGAWWQHMVGPHMLRQMQVSRGKKPSPPPGTSRHIHGLLPGPCRQRSLTPLTS